MITKQNQLNNKNNKINNQKGMAAALMLVMFILITLIFYSLYKTVLADYIVINKSLESQSNQLRQTNLVETLRYNYLEDMRNDISFDGMSNINNEHINSEIGHSMIFKENFDKYKASEEGFDKELLDTSVESGYINFKYEFDKSEGSDSCSSENSSLDQNGEVRSGDFGRCDWNEFLNYKEELPNPNDDYPKYKRTYKINDNWNRSSKLKDKCFGVCEINSDNEWNLMLPKMVYLKIDFDSSVEGLEIKMGNDSQYIDNYFINRKKGYEIVKFDDLPVNLSVKDIILSSDNDLGSTSFSILTSREVDIEVFEQDGLGIDKDKDKKVLLSKTLKVKLDKYSNKVDFNTMEER